MRDHLSSGSKTRTLLGPWDFVRSTGQTLPPATPPPSVPLGPGHCTQDLGWRPHGEGGGWHGVQASGAEAGRGQQAETLEEASKQQEQLCPGQALPYTDTAACGEIEARARCVAR